MSEKLNELLELVETMVFTRYHNRGQNYKEYRVGEDIKEMNRKLNLIDELEKEDMLINFRGEWYKFSKLIAVYEQ